jgi:drug/metabolite transporter (DMT)-like permease
MSMSMDGTKEMTLQQDAESPLGVSDGKVTVPAPQPTPWWIWVILLISVVGVSSAGPMFAELGDVPPLLRASWRLQATSLLLLFPACVVQWFLHTDELMRRKCFEMKTISIILMSAIMIAGHFGAWVCSIEMTALTHSLLFVTAHPVVVAIGMIVLHRVPFKEWFGLDIQIRSPNALEICGTLLAFGGAGISFMDEGSKQSEDGHAVTVEGDFIAFLGAVFFVGYMICGRVLRSWMPIFIYAFPVTFFGGMFLVPLSYAFEHRAEGMGLLWGYYDLRYFWWFLIMSFIAGILGHTGFNMCLQYLSSLVVSTSLVFEPIVGTLIAYILFKVDVPGTFTYIGGSLLLIGILAVIIGSEEEKEIESKEEIPTTDPDSNENIEIDTDSKEVRAGKSGFTALSIADRDIV